jgi:hypothetical protein
MLSDQTVLSEQLHHVITHRCTNYIIKMVATNKLYHNVITPIKGTSPNTRL